MPLDRRQFLTLAATALAGPMTHRAGSTADDPTGGDERIVAALRPIHGDAKVPGLVGAIVEPGKVPRLGAVGVRKEGSPEPFGPGDLVHLGSCTKAMTATMIATLAEDRAIAWESTLAEVFPDAKLHEGYRPVTLAQLLTHRAGLPANVAWRGREKGTTTTEQRRAVLGQVAGMEPSTKPGSKMVYSNVGYALAGLMAETRAKASWEVLMRERLFAPLKMDSAGFGAPGTPGKVDQPWGHSRTLGKLIPSQTDNAPALGPAGTLHCSMADWAKFAELHLRGARGEKPPILRPETFAALHASGKGADYAKGWGVADRDWAGGAVLTHKGSNTQWFAAIWLAPKKNIGFLAATNCGGDGADAATDKTVAAMIGVRGG